MELTSDNNGLFGVRTTKDDDATIARVYRGGSAEKAGLTVGDRIISVDGKKVERWSDVPSKKERMPYEIVVHRGGHNGGERTPVEDLSFDWQLKHSNLLYLGGRVLVLLDLSYQSRFWCAPP